MLGAMWSQPSECHLDREGWAVGSSLSPPWPQLEAVASGRCVSRAVSRAPEASGKQMQKQAAEGALKCHRHTGPDSWGQAGRHRLHQE